MPVSLPYMALHRLSVLNVRFIHILPLLHLVHLINILPLLGIHSTVHCVHDEIILPLCAAWFQGG